jgi:hypothetical protein
VTARRSQSSRPGASTPCDPDVVPGQGTRPCREAHLAARHSRQPDPADGHLRTEFTPGGL